MRCQPLLRGALLHLFAPPPSLAAAYDTPAHGPSGPGNNHNPDVNVSSRVWRTSPSTVIPGFQPGDGALWLFMVGSQAKRMPQAGDLASRGGQNAGAGGDRSRNTRGCFSSRAKPDDRGGGGDADGREVRQKDPGFRFRFTQATSYKQSGVPGLARGDWWRPARRGDQGPAGGGRGRPPPAVRAGMTCRPARRVGRSGRNLGAPEPVSGTPASSPNWSQLGLWPAFPQRVRPAPGSGRGIHAFGCTRFRDCCLFAIPGA